MLVKKVENYIKEYNLLEQNSRVVVGVSGGADSVCLLLILCELSKKMNLTISAHHINHMIRGLEAEADEVFVKRLCERLCIEFRVSRIDVPTYAKEHKLSEEEAGRIIRYNELRRLGDGALIAVAHNEDDQVETILHNIIRGTNLKGLSGMKPRKDDIIRPLLCASRNEIEDYLKNCGQDFRTDSTNNSTNYTRNKIRLEIIPKIKEINPGFSKHLLELSKSIEKADDEITKKAYDLIGNLEKDAGPTSAVIDKAIYLSIAEIAGEKKDITSKHVEAVHGLIGSQVGSEVHLANGVIAKRGYDSIEISKKTESKKEEKTENSLKKRVKRLNKQLKKSEIRRYNGEEIPDETFTKWLDYDKIKGKLFWRYRAKGDRISLDNACHKKLKDYMIDQKIPREERDKVPLLTDGQDVVWVLGGRISADYKISKNTKNIIIIKTGE